jgi:hypothetical protein
VSCTFNSEFSVSSCAPTLLFRQFCSVLRNQHAQQDIAVAKRGGKGNTTEAKVGTYQPKHLFVQKAINTTTPQVERKLDLLGVSKRELPSHVK